MCSLQLVASGDDHQQGLAWHRVQRHLVEKCFGGANFLLMLRGGNWSILVAGGIPLPPARLLLNDCSSTGGHKAPVALIKGFYPETAKK